MIDSKFGIIVYDEQKPTHALSYGIRLHYHFFHKDMSWHKNLYYVRRMKSSDLQSPPNNSANANDFDFLRIRTKTIDAIKHIKKFDLIVFLGTQWKWNEEKCFDVFFKNPKYKHKEKKWLMNVKYASEIEELINTNKKIGFIRVYHGDPLFI